MYLKKVAVRGSHLVSLDVLSLDGIAVKIRMWDSLSPRPICPIFYYMDGRERSGNIVYQELCQGGGVSGDAVNINT